MGYLKLLYKKTIKKWSSLFLIVFLITGIVGLYLVHLHASSFYSYVGQGKDHYQSMLELEEYYTNLLNDELEYSTEEVQSFKNGLQDTRNQKEWNENILELAEKEKWSEALGFSIKIINQHLEVNEKAGNELFPEEHVLALKQEKLLFQELAYLNIAPDMEGYERYGFTYVYRVMDSLYPTFFVFIITVFLTEIFVSNYKIGSNVELILPSPYKNILIIKVLYSLLASVLLYIATLMFSFVLASLITGIGSLQYPIPLYSENTIDTVPIWRIIGETFTLHLLSILDIVFIVSIISHIAKNRMITLLVTIVIIIGCSVGARSLEVFHPLLHLNPFTYFLATDVVTNELVYETGNSNINFINGVFYLGILATVLLSVTLVLVQQQEKRQMLGRV